MSQKNDPYAKGPGRPHTITSMDDTGASTNLQSSPTNLHGALPGGEGDGQTLLTGRSSRVSDHQSGDLTQRSRGSISSHNSHASTLQGNELPPEVAAGDS